MRIHCLGTAGFHPNSTRHTSCYFLPESGLLLDAGTGIFRLAPLIETDTIDILISHAHLDHTAGLTFLLDVFYVRPVKRVRIFGEKAKLDAIRDHIFSDLIFPVPLDAEFLAIDELDEFSAGGATITWRPQEHPGGSVGYRMVWQKQDKQLVYATDTTGDCSAEATEWYSGSDLMMHECYFRDSAREWAEKTGHSWTSRVIEIAKAAKPNKLMVTHINPLDANAKAVANASPSASSENTIGDAEPDSEVELDVLKENLDAEVLLAEDGLVVDF